MRAIFRTRMYPSPLPLLESGEHVGRAANLPLSGSVRTLSVANSKPSSSSPSSNAQSNRPRKLPWSRDSSRTDAAAKGIPATNSDEPGQLVPSLPQIDWRVHCTRSYAKTVIGTAKLLKVCSAEIVAFDMEWAVFRKLGQAERPTSLIQVCNDKHIGLFHIHHMKPPRSSVQLGTEVDPAPSSTFPAPLRRLIEDPNIIKVGLNIGGDARKLKRDYGIEMQGWLDLMDLAKEVADDLRSIRSPLYKEFWNHMAGRSRISLLNLCELTLGVTLDKDSGVRMSNWEAARLTERQLDYAANDVYATYQAYQCLQRIQKDVLNPSASNLELRGMVGVAQQDADTQVLGQTHPAPSVGRCQNADLYISDPETDALKLGNSQVQSTVRAKVLTEPVSPNAGQRPLPSTRVTRSVAQNERADKRRHIATSSAQSDYVEIPADDSPSDDSDVDWVSIHIECQKIADKFYASQRQ
ncbi:ribonuclease H-like domain-containing protein [Gaertneriomyces semiglobifer]|nr:ribonuclease H-like domain-containing protein [Gaertneriomyces semiglobifer]